ncbi:ATP-NAD kinase-like domain-containing protein [Massariosphaeria phaeospora]|uniref:ATP-NAD kinase-like domain-containing protein n=1 Tax=Massariosphaeria phaeospora TaxID=100035 RepID=A0A7C8I1P1_9PLEO|nr:ATP-NAD kinase-like domain-containing protein [Massariosphaeria phaeospora]
MKLVPHRVLPWRGLVQPPSRAFSSTTKRALIKPISELPDRITPTYQQRPSNTLLALEWPSPPRNILITKKKRTPGITASLVEYTTHLASTYPSINIIVEPESAAEIHEQLAFPVYTYSTPSPNSDPPHLSDKTDLVCTLGGDGTILRASSLFSHAATVPPILSFAMGTIGFLGEWKFREYKKAFREVYMSGASDAYAKLEFPESEPDSAPAPRTCPEDPLDKPLSYADIRGKAMGSTRTARILLRNRLRVGVFGPDGQRLNSAASSGDTYALNEVILHRGSSPHLKIIDVFVGGRFLTEAVADGMIISSPTGSTAYSLSSGGSIVHPLVPSLCLTPICPRSLSFRPLVLPAETPITLRLGDKNRGRDVEVSIDGKRISEGIGEGMEVRVVGEQVRSAAKEWCGGVPSIVRGLSGTEADEEDHWVGGLNALLKFNYPFGDQDAEGGHRWA